MVGQAYDVVVHVCCGAGVRLILRVRDSLAKVRSPVMRAERRLKAEAQERTKVARLVALTLVRADWSALIGPHDWSRPLDPRARRRVRVVT